MRRLFRLKIPSLPKKFAFIAAVGALILIIIFMSTILFNLVVGGAELTGLRAYVVTNCTDTDNGSVQIDFGSCTNGLRKTQYDTCVITGGLREPLKLREWYCSENKTCESFIANCSPGFSCVGGRCLKI